MFLSKDKGVDEHPVFTTDTRSLSFNNDMSLNSKLDFPFSFYPFPTTFAELDHSQLQVGGHFLPQQQLLSANTNLVTEILIDMAVSERKSTMPSSGVNASNRNYRASMATAEKQNPQQKRSVKRDRHSKITTAQGIRDRRMRLSLDVAREFFGLQDARGDDKPSKTIRWLLNQCKGAIKELIKNKELETNCGAGGGAKSVSSTSECEVMSGIEETSNAVDHEEMIPEKKTSAKERKKQPRKTKFHPIGRESREKARARARERTREKKRESNEYIAEASTQKMISSSPSETGEESGVSHGHEMKSSMAEVEEPNSLLLDLQRPTGIDTTSKSSSSSIFSFQLDTAISQGLVCSSSNNNNVPSYFENWDIDLALEHTIPTVL